MRIDICIDMRIDMRIERRDVNRQPFGTSPRNLWETEESTSVKPSATHFSTRGADFGRAMVMAVCGLRAAEELHPDDAEDQEVEHRHKQHVADRRQTRNDRVHSDADALPHPSSSLQNQPTFFLRFSFSDFS